MPPKNPSRSPVRGAQAKSWGRLEEDPSSPAPLQENALVQVIADLRARFDSLAAAVNRPDPEQARTKRAPAAEPDDVARRLQFDALAPLPEPQPVGIITDSDSRNGITC